jgi:N-acetylated-alpha-linked acidic dipeptidase
VVSKAGESLIVALVRVRLWVVWWICAGVSAVTTGSADSAPSMYGFSASAADLELTLERSFDQSLSAADLRAWMQRMAAEPNQVGSPHDRANAQFMLEQFRSWGWQADIETFYVLYPTPKQELLELVAPQHYRAKLHEPSIAGDRSSQISRDVLPPYNVYGADGDVTAQLVYVNYGMPEDYKELARRGVSVSGRIAIARYGDGWRGLKPKLANEHGAIGCIIYSDPRDDGYAVGDPYPAGPARPVQGVQRGSVEDITLYSGDPLTPGVGATREATRLSRAQAKVLLKIPVLPISYGDAQPLLSALAGPRAPPNWRGALPITYHLGPGPATVHLKIESDWSQKPIYDVIARLAGSESPDEWVIRGNHHDGWVFGAWDPLSANIALMAEMKAMGRLAAQGWHPKRTLLYASWDGEEAGLLGSTEWAETHAEELKERAVAYVNSDLNGRGFMQAGGSHALQRLVNEVGSGIRDPETGASVLARAQARVLVAANSEGATDGVKYVAAKLRQGGQLPLQPLGWHSDYTPFLQHLGISTLDFGYGDGEPSGTYHSLYDTYDHYVKVVDPDFAYGIVLSQTIGHVVLRLANSELLPLHFTEFAATMSRYDEELEKLTETMREHAVETNRLIDEHAYDLASSRHDPVGPPAREVQVPYVNFAPLKNAITELTASARACDEAYAKALVEPTQLTAAQRTDINALLRASEQQLLSTRGLPGRPWYQHLIYAPGRETGYAAKTLPGVREAIEQRHFAEAAEYVGVTAAALEAYREQIDRITAALNM